MPADSGIATQLLNALVFTLSGGMARSLPHVMSLLRQLATLELVAAGLLMALGARQAGVKLFATAFWLSTLAWLAHYWGDAVRVIVEGMIQHGLLLGGGALTLQDIQNPGNISHHGFAVVGVLLKRLMSLSGLVLNPVSAILLGFAALAIWGTFFILTAVVVYRWVALHLLVSFSVILLPLGALRITRPFMTKTLAMVFTQAVSLGMIALLLSAIQPFLVTLVLSPEPTLGEALSLLAGSGMFAVLAVYIPALIGELISGGVAIGAIELASVAQSAVQGTRMVAHGAHTLSTRTTNAIADTRAGVGAAPPSMSYHPADRNVPHQATGTGHSSDRGGRGV